jgi:NAD(P)-dependent dehydrogenase (short-subunit alcohol dehydrogenase family)
MKPDRPFAGQVALVTEGGEGVGRAVAMALAARGVRVVVTGGAERALGEVVGEIANGGGTARHRAGDMRDAAHVQAAVQKSLDAFGRLDIVVANAAASSDAPAKEGGPTKLADAAAAEAIFSARLLRIQQTLEYAVPHLQDFGRLLALGSGLSLPSPPGLAYAASKARLAELARTLATKHAVRTIACWALDSSLPLDPESLAEYVVKLASGEERAPSGHTLELMVAREGSLVCQA